MHTVIGGGYSLEHQAFEQALPNLIQKFYSTFGALKDNCQAANLLTDYQIMRQFGGHGATPADEASTLLHIVLRRIAEDPANFYTFKELDVVKSEEGKLSNTDMPHKIK